MRWARGGIAVSQRAMSAAAVAALTVGLAAWPQASAARAPASPPKIFRDCDTVCPEMVAIPPGQFLMGSPDKEPGRIADESPRHKVTLARTFAVGRFETTFDEWDACVADGGCKPAEGQPLGGGDAGWGRGRRPVINVSWDDAQAYVAWLSKHTGQPYRLLTEAEWEYVARAGGQTPYAGGQAPAPDQANFQASGLGKTQPVGAYPANAFGVHDMAGNVWEWVRDCYATSYALAPVDGAPNLGGDCVRRMLRGGAWNVPAPFLRSAARARNKASLRDTDFGFRVARDLP